MNLWTSISGMIRGTLTGADISGSLGAIARNHITLQDVTAVDPLTVTFYVFRRDWKALSRLCEKRGDKLEFDRGLGLYWYIRRLLGRPVLVGGLGLLLALTLYLPSRVLFVQVEGNQDLPAALILEQAEHCGIRFGASRREVRSEKMKNALLSSLEALKWAGVNTRGCVAVISVREKPASPQIQEDPGLCSVIAGRDGFITSCTVTAGNALCQPGQTVKQGQVLISPYRDCGLHIQVTPARGEIMAKTNRDLLAVTPDSCLQLTGEEEKISAVSLILGKKRINLWKDSGIWDSTCGRMYREYDLTLPGGFRLPVSLAVERRICRQSRLKTVDAEQARHGLTVFSRHCTAQQMIAGKILKESTGFSRDTGRYQLQCHFQCSEMIGRQCRAKIGDRNEQNS